MHKSVDRGGTDGLDTVCTTPRRVMLPKMGFEPATSVSVDSLSDVPTT